MNGFTIAKLNLAENNIQYLKSYELHIHKFLHCLIFSSKFINYFNIETGEVTNWPKNCPFDFTNIKIVDTGTYVIHTPLKIFAYQGYVPNCLGAGSYGDYLTFEIDENSHIVDWKFDQEIFDEFMSNVEDY